MSDVPERVWISKAGIVLLYQGSGNIEYIRKDIAEKEKQEALKPIRKVWERFHKDKDGGFKHCDTHGNTLYWLDKFLFASKTALGEK